MGNCDSCCGCGDCGCCWSCSSEHIETVALACVCCINMYRNCCPGVQDVDNLVEEGTGTNIEGNVRKELNNRAPKNVR